MNENLSKFIEIKVLLAKERKNKRTEKEREKSYPARVVSKVHKLKVLFYAVFAGWRCLVFLTDWFGAFVAIS